MTDQGGAAAGLFITFEGGDGAGKTTQLDRVREWFETHGHRVLVTREPGGTELGTDLRRLIQHGPEDVDARTEALLYAADRAYHVATVVRPALAAGTIVLGDRYIDSSLAYQGAARDLGVEEIRSLSLWATQGLQPDLTFLLDLPPDVGARRDTGEPDRIERESTDFHERVRHEYLHLAEEYPTRIVVIDGVGTPEQVFAEIQGVLEERLPALLGEGAQDGASVGADARRGPSGSGSSGSGSSEQGAPAPETVSTAGSGSAPQHTRTEGLTVLTEAQAALWGEPGDTLL
ncbi:MAG: dTMP kinase [Propionibacterium sp.]|nr:dTMP kinase [Actinomyces sp.]MDN6794593.1 dTMP kinase [Propionibacterium sp.]